MALGVKNPPEPKIERIAGLVTRIKSGDIKIPKFQRGFVWYESQIIDLLESIYEGYPIGSLLFWLSETPMKSERDMGGFELPETPEKYPRNYVLDGQQRLTTIYGVLNWPDRDKLHKLNVRFDLDNLSFQHFAGEHNDRHVPMNILFNTSEFIEFQKKLSEFTDGKELIDRANVLYETFREYLIPVVTIQEKSVEDVCPIFERINSTGTQLNQFDLMVAATWSNAFDLNDQVAEIRDSAKLKDFENIDNTIYLKMMSSIHGFGSKRTGVFKLRSLSPEVLITLAKTVQNSAERAIDFLSTDISVPSDAFLPYENLLVVYAYFFSKVKTPTHDQLNALRKWFWQCGFSEHFRGATEGFLEQDLASVDCLIEGDLNALKLPFNLEKSDLLRRQFWKNSAFSKTFAVMLARKNPRNLTNGEMIDTEKALSVFNEKEFHHIFPKDFLKGLGIEIPKRNNICNVCFLSSLQNKRIGNAPPSSYLNESLRDLKEEGEDVLASNLIPFGDGAPWAKDDYGSFLEVRAAMILEEIRNNW